jgi:type IV secretory pathway VirB6-like protein
MFLWLVLFASNAMAYNSYLEYIRGSTTNFCFDNDNILWGDVSTLYQTTLPTSLGGSGGQTLNNSYGFNNASASSVGASIASLISFSATGFLRVAVDFLIMLDLCNGFFVMPYYEELTFAAGSVTLQNAGSNASYAANGTRVYTATDIPYRFQCSDPGKRGFDVTLCQKFPDFAVDPSQIDQINGYMKSAMANIANGFNKGYSNGQTISAPGSSFSNYLICGNAGNPTSFPPPSGATPQFAFDLQANMTQAVCFLPLPPVAFNMQAFYYFNENASRINLCIGTNILIPMVLGCTGVAPPISNLVVDYNLANYIAGTRCEYLITGRTDLQSLGRNLPDGSFARFLQSDMHVTSTVVGCIQDLLARSIVPYQTGMTMQTPYFSELQASLNNIVVSALVLYLVVTGIKIIGSPQPMKRTEIIMTLFKYAMVVFFATSDVWSTGTYFGSGSDAGLYKAMMRIPETIGSIFMDALSSVDYLGRCTMPTAGLGLGDDWPATAPSFDLADYLSTFATEPNGMTFTVPTSTPCTNGSNPLYTSNNTPSGSYNANLPQPGVVYQTTGVVSSSNGCVVRTTIWDLIDCKVVNYLNFGNCKYSYADFILIWMIGASGIAMFVDQMTIIATQGLSGISATEMMLHPLFFFSFSIVLTMIFLVIFKYVHIFLISAFIVTVLVLIAPIMMVFSLFGATKAMFQKWYKLMLGYLIYPGLLFAFFCLMMTAMDALFFGYVPMISAGQTLANITINDVNNVCQGNLSASAYCMGQAGNGAIYDPCTASEDTLNTFTQEVNIIFTKFRILKLPSSLSDVSQIGAMLSKLIFFAGIFYLFAQTVAETLAGLCGLQRLSQDNMAMGSFNFMNMRNSVADSMSKARKAAFGAATSAGKAGMRNIQNSRDGVKGKVARSQGFQKAYNSKLPKIPGMGGGGE